MIKGIPTINSFSSFPNTFPGCFGEYDLNTNKCSTCDYNLACARQNDNRSEKYGNRF